jgi:hypothetical protein
VTENPFLALLDVAADIANFMTDPTDAQINLMGTNTPRIEVSYLRGNDTAAADLASYLGFAADMAALEPEYAHLHWRGVFEDVSVRVTVLVPTVEWLRRTVDGFDELPEQGPRLSSERRPLERTTPTSHELRLDELLVEAATAEDSRDPARIAATYAAAHAYAVAAGLHACGDGAFPDDCPGLSADLPNELDPYEVRHAAALAALRHGEGPYA